MSRALLILSGDEQRRMAIEWIRRAPVNTRVEFKRSKRTLDQNAKMWCLLSELAMQLLWHGVKLTPDDWKLIMLDALKRELRIVPNIDGSGVVNLGRSSSDLSKEEMSDLIELIQEFGARHGVVFGDRGGDDRGVSG